MICLPILMRKKFPLRQDLRPNAAWTKAQFFCICSKKGQGRADMNVDMQTTLVYRKRQITGDLRGNVK